MYLGIDLGTSNSAAVGNTGSELRLFKTVDGFDVLPSAIFIDPRGHRFVGRRAYEQAALNPDNVALQFKRVMGTSTPLRFEGPGIVLTPEEASAEVLRALLAQVQAETGSTDIEGAIVTIPAAFNQMQTEATIMAADLGGIAPVGLIHEPIAAAMASMAHSKTRSGQFIVYDLGGGTFDVALVQSSGGTVNVIAHEGVNMLGGRDFDSALMRDIVSPWLEEHFDLDPEYRLDPSFEKILRRLRMRVEQAKIELSTRDRTTLFVAEDELRLTDRQGREIYLDVELTRSHLEELVGPRVTQTIDLCRKVIADNGFKPEDIDRVVLIGGPSKMPLVRQRVPEELGIATDLSTDPMTAVATGAAIYAESRDWSGEHTSRKRSRASQTSSEALGVKYDYPSRTSEDRVRLRVGVAATQGGDWRLRVDSPDGWTSGEVPLVDGMRLELPVSKPGDNHFKATLSAPGQPAEVVDLTIARTFASSAGVPATLTLSVVVEEDVGGSRREMLHPLVLKGTMLPAKGRNLFRAARPLVGGTDEHIDVKVFEAASDITDPDLGQMVGSFRLCAASHLEKGETLRAGDPVVINWSVDDNGLLTCTIELPEQRRLIEAGRIYSADTGHKNYDGDEGAELAAALVGQAREEIDEAADTLTETNWFVLQELKARIDAEEAVLASTHDPDARRQAAEVARQVRQDLSRLKHAPENTSLIITQDLARLEELFETVLREAAEPSQAARFDQLAAAARRYLDGGEPRDAEGCVNQMREIVFGELVKIPQFVQDRFETLAAERYHAIDKSLHDKLVSIGGSCIARGDWEGVRRVIDELVENRFSAAAPETRAGMLAGLLKG